jgi:hypothetical protein
MHFKLALVALSALVLTALAASTGTAFAQAAFPHGSDKLSEKLQKLGGSEAVGTSHSPFQTASERSLGAPAHPAGGKRSAGTAAGGQDGEQRLSAGPVIGLICAIAASSLALGIAFGLRRRIDRIAGPDPDKEDDG